MGLLANTLIGCLFALLPGPPGFKLDNAYIQLFPVDKQNTWCPELVPGKDVSFYAYNEAFPDKPTQLIVGEDALLKSSSINLQLPTVFYFPPFFEGVDSRSVTLIRKAYMKIGGHNFIVVDSRRLNAGPWYAAAVTNTYFVGRYAARFIDYLLQKGLSFDRLHLIGLSIGAHTAGIAGHLLKAGRPPRITGLDPASPLFENMPLELRLSESDAQMVDVIHTDHVFGMSAPVGHADFFVNAGESPQPGCEFLKVVKSTKRLLPTVFCSHLRSYELYAESVLWPYAFPAASCSSWLELKMKKCSFDDIEYMGKATSFGARGVFYVPTGSYATAEKTIYSQGARNPVLGLGEKPNVNSISKK